MAFSMIRKKTSSQVALEYTEMKACSQALLTNGRMCNLGVLIRIFYQREKALAMELDWTRNMSVQASWLGRRDDSITYAVFAEQLLACIQFTVIQSLQENSICGKCESHAFCRHQGLCRPHFVRLPVRVNADLYTYDR